MGDFNLDPKLLLIKEENKTKNQKNYNKMWTQMSQNILENGISILNKKNTRHQGNQASQLDLIMTNRPEKITSTSQIDDTFSDHSLMILTRKSNIIQQEERLLKDSFENKTDHITKFII